MAFESVNPATGKILQRFQELDDRAVDRALSASIEAFGVYRQTNFAERASKMNAAADIAMVTLHYLPVK